MQLPGRESRWNEPPLDRVDAILDSLVPALLPHLDLPFAFFGHSMGALIASELVVALQQRGGPMPEHLFVSSRRAPHTPDPDPPLSGLSHADFVIEIQRRYGGIPAEVLRDDEMMALLLPALRADVLALETYRPGTDLRVSCPLSVFGGSRDPRVPRAHLEAWGELADADFRLRVFDGDHFYIAPRRAELLAEIVNTLKPWLRDDRSESPRAGNAPR